MTTEQFILQHREDDVKTLALQAKRHTDIDIAYALDQIEGWQRARKKLPSWTAINGIIYPPHISIEQCSGEHTARYKASVVSRLSTKDKFIDITGGFGVDFSFMSSGFKHAVYIERQEHLCKIAEHNFKLLGLVNAEVVCGDGIEYLHSIENADIIYLDPARRDSNGGRAYAIEDCTPNVLALENELINKAHYVIIKLSPMLDWHDAVRSFNNINNNVVKEVHIISTRNECKELLFVLQKGNIQPLTIYCVNDNDVFSFAENSDSTFTFANEIKGYLYEPNASIMKAGCFGEICRQYNVSPLGRNSHLFVSNDNIYKFPGRSFIIHAVCSLNKKALSVALSEITKANITVRNFPMTVNELRKKLKLNDGGDTYIFATTTNDNKRVLIVCQKK